MTGFFDWAGQTRYYWKGSRLIHCHHCRQGLVCSRSQYMELVPWFYITHFWNCVFASAIAHSNVLAKAIWGSKGFWEACQIEFLDLYRTKFGLFVTISFAVPNWCFFRHIWCHCCVFAKLQDRKRVYYFSDAWHVRLPDSLYFIFFKKSVLIYFSKKCSFWFCSIVTSCSRKWYSSTNFWNQHII